MDKNKLIKNIKLGENGCWNWIRAKNKEGYGILKINGKMEMAHRVSYELFSGKIDKEFICHKCDNPSCINPSHLFSGSRSDNMKDAFNKGRIKIPKFNKYGEDSTNHKLKEKDVIDIINSNDSPKEIMKKYDIHKSQFYKIKNGQSWKHLSYPSQRIATINSNYLKGG